jgi:hypothetical protein
MITALPGRIAALPDELRQVCEWLFAVEVATGYTDPPAALEAWIGQQFGAVGAVREQTIVKVVNRLTLEAAIFNPLRARRPRESSGGDAELEARIAERLAAHDMFRQPLHDTTADVFGRIRGRFCITASNIAKYDGWHGLVIFDEPHPLRFGQEQLRDYLDVAFRWIAAAHARDGRAIYPIITWNCLPKSGATLMHGHMQMALARGMPYARVECWRRAAAAYRAHNGADYFADLFAVHQALGLTIPCVDGLHAFAHLTPLRDREIVLLANQGPGRQGARAQDLADALYAILRGLIDRQGVRAFNVAIALPPLAATTEDWCDIPVIARLADRGDPLAASSDLGAMELFATGCVVSDPFEVASSLRNPQWPAVNGER